MSAYNDAIVAEFRATGGESSQYPPGSLILLHNRGARSGEWRVNPLMHVEHEGRIVVMASMGGAPRNPDWYHNVRAHPEVEVERGTSRWRARAEAVTGEERDRLAAALIAAHPRFAAYAGKTRRTIPVIALTPAGDAPGATAP